MHKSTLEQSLSDEVKIQRDKILRDLKVYKGKLDTLISDLEKAQTLDQILDLMQGMIK